MSTPAFLFDTRAARRIDQEATAALGGDGYTLMQRAGQAAWDLFGQRWPGARRVAVACGSGNNGGDGFVLARLALQAGLDVQVVLPEGVQPRTPLARRAAADYADAGGICVQVPGDLVRPDVWVDALLGIGLEAAPRAPVARLIGLLNDAATPVLALDVPSGIDADRGTAPGAAVRADCTLQFIVPHAGLHTGTALDHVGERLLHALQVDADAYNGVAPPCARLLRAADLWPWLQPRLRDSHKGRAGHVLCVGGDHGGGGAVLLATEAALRAGAGLASVATRGVHLPALLARRPEAMVHAVEEAQALVESLQRASVVACGPGLGQRPWGRALHAAVLRSGLPLVLDADALNLLAADPVPPPDAILTPHPGEAARLLGCSTSAIQADRFAAAAALAERYASVVVLKGAGSIVAAPGHLPRVLDAGNPGMATGGMGDLLTGTIAAMRAQGLGAFDAACAGALLHSLAGDAAAAEGGQRGLLPSDLLPWLRRLANPSSPQAVSPC